MYTTERRGWDGMGEGNGDKGGLEADERKEQKSGKKEKECEETCDGGLRE